jgi:glycosyltransferase involved in cell wall biosynthesis
MLTQQNMSENNREQIGRRYTIDLSPYPIDVSSLFSFSHCTFDASGVPYRMNPVGYHPTTIAHYALVQWNEYVTTGAEDRRKDFLSQANWLIEHEVRIGEDASGWPISFPHPDVPTGRSWLSASAQGSILSVLLRAYQLTGEEIFLATVHRVVRNFERDILDGGVSAPVGTDGVFFEEAAVYPAAHTLSGFIFALLGLYEYVAMSGDNQIEKLIHRSLATLHKLFDEFDTGFWTHVDLLQRRLATPAHLALQTTLLEVLAACSGCEHCSTSASRWRGYHRRLESRLRYLIASRSASYCQAFWHWAQASLFPRSNADQVLRVCVPVTGFPVMGGIRTVLAGIAQVTSDIWRMEYLTQYIGPHPEGFAIHRFGLARMSPWQFPMVWLYFLAGLRKLISLMRHSAGYQAVLPQDGVFTAAFAALGAKIAGVRVVCIDHGNLTLLKSRAYRSERLKALATRHWLYRLLGPLLYSCYWPSLYLLAWLAGRFVDQYLIPGVEGDGTEEICQHLGIPSSRITRYASIVEVDSYVVLDATFRARKREEKGLATDAIIISMVCRLTPEKGIGVALGAISLALSKLAPALSKRVRVIIAGKGPLRGSIEEDISRRGLSQTCALWGETTPSDVISLLSFSDIFLYTSTRGACFSMAVLEAMASGCAVVASTEPLANAYLLADGRGIAVPPADSRQTALALVHLIQDLELCRQMGDLARKYIVDNHSAEMFRRTLLRATRWIGLDEFLSHGMET